MKKNDTFEVIIKDMGINGEGIGKYEGMTFFVKDAVVGDRILAGVTKLKKGYGYARLIEVLEPSEFRVEPICAISRQCGGCQIQNVSYAKQLELKQKKVWNNLSRIGGVAPETLDKVMEPIVGMEEPFRYRNKAQFPVGTDREGNTVFGFYAARSHQVIPVEDCYLGVEENAQILNAIKAYMDACGVKPYNEETGKGRLRHILIRKGFTSGEIMVCLVVNGESLPEVSRLIESLKDIKGMRSISLNVNTENTNVILGQETKLLWGERTITDCIHRMSETSPGIFESIGQGVDFMISARSFYQVNPIQTEKLYSIALDYAGLTGEEVVWDLYCGIGTITLFLAGEAKQVYGVEIVPEAIEDARKNAAANHIENAEFYVGRAEEVVPRWMEQEQSERRHPDVIVVDPPRKGLDEVCVETILEAAPKRIVYVSCDSATLARDLKLFLQQGYELKRVRPVDQFCHSMHVESCVLLCRTDT